MLASNIRNIRFSLIGDYIDLEIYIKNNKGIMEALAKTFFTTGKTVSKFVKITYDFQTSNDTQSIEDETANRQQSTYVWSETSLYLLGPRALYWFTLSAICVDEVDVTIELPCLCDDHDVYDSLLSRLTFLVLHNHIDYYVVIV